MKIVIITGPFVSVPPAPCGAIERAWWGLSRSFAAAGHQVTFYARTPSPDTSVPQGVELRSMPGMARGGKLSVDLVKDLGYSFRALRRVQSADIIIPHTFWLPVLMPRIRPGAGHVVSQISRFPKGQIKWYRKCSALVVPSSAIGNAVKEQCPPAAPLVNILPYSIETDLFVPPGIPRAPKPSTGTLLYTGRIVPEKGLHLLVAAWAALRNEMPDLKLALMGPMSVDEGGGGEAYRKQLLDAARGHLFEIRDPVYDAAELAKALQAADYYCYPSLAERGETFGVAPLEAMGAGLTPIVSDLSCFRDFLVEGENGSVFDHRADDAVTQLTDVIRRVVSDPQAVQRMGKKAAATAQRYSNQAVAKRYLALFERVMGGDH